MPPYHARDRPLAFFMPCNRKVLPEKGQDKFKPYGI